MRTFAGLLIGFCAVVVVVVAGLAGLAQLKFSSFLSDSIGERLEIVAATSVRDFGVAIDLGLHLDEVANGAAILERARSHDPRIGAIAVFDLDGNILHAIGDVGGAQVHAQTQEALRLARSGVADANWSVEADERIRSGLVLEGSHGRAVGAVVVHYPTTEMGEQQERMAGQLLVDAVGVGLILMILVLLMLVLLRTRILRLDASDRSEPNGGAVSTEGQQAVGPDDAQRTSRLLVSGISILLIVGIVAFGALVVQHFNSALEPELARRAALIGVTVRDDTERGLELGIPLDGLVGMDEYFAVFLADLAFLLTLAIASPFAGRLHLSFGQRGLFIIGMLASASSYLGLVFATDLVQIMALRALTGVGYAFATIACFEYLLDRRSDDSRERTIGMFVAVIMGGTFAGTAIGGILADRLGYRPVFAISFFIVIVSGALALRMMKRGSAGEHDGSAAFKLANLVGVLKRPRLVALLAGITIPMNVLMAAFLWYLVPLTLAAAGSGAAAIARTLMVYYLVILVGGPLFSRLGNTRMRPWVLVGIGLLLSSAVLLVPAMNPTALTISLAVLVVGLGHAAVGGPQFALALDIADEGAAEGAAEGGRGPTLAAMRSLERLGSLVGLLIVALLAARFDLLIAMGVIGVAGAAAAVLYLVFHPQFAKSKAHV